MKNVAKSKKEIGKPQHRPSTNKLHAIQTTIIKLPCKATADAALQTK